MKIVHTESSLGWGGQEIRVLAESRGMRERGHEVTVVCAEGARILEEAPRWQVPVVALPIGRKNWTALRSLKDWLSRHRCDVLNTHSSTDSWLGSLATAWLGRPWPVVRTRHISAAVPQGPLSRWLYMRASSRVITTGEALRRQLIETNGFDPRRIESIPTGIDARAFVPGDRRAARAKLGLPADAVLVGIVATLRSWKGHADLLEAMARVPGELQLVIVGDGPQREALEAKSKALGLEARVRMVGQQADVVPWMQSLDIFVLPSYANEGVPQALIQAMLAALPAVTTPVGGIPELAEHERTALLVPPRDIAALAAAITRLGGDAALRQVLGAAARRHCEANYSYERMLDRMEGAYRHVLAPR